MTEAFEERWPEKEVAVKTRAERQERLMQEVLRDSDISERTTVDGIEVYTHVRWAHAIQDLASAVPDETGFFIGSVYRLMPRVLRNEVVAATRRYRS